MSTGIVVWFANYWLTGTKIVAREFWKPHFLFVAGGLY